MIRIAVGSRVYRQCEAGDVAALYECRRGELGAPSFEQVVGGVSKQLRYDDTADYEELDAVGERHLVVTEHGRVIGMVSVDIDDRGGAFLQAWTRPGQAHPEAVLDFAGDALEWLRSAGITRATVRAYVRAYEGLSGAVPARTAAWKHARIPERSAVLPELTYTRT